VKSLYLVCFSPQYFHNEALAKQHSFIFHGRQDTLGWFLQAVLFKRKVMQFTS